MDGLEGWGVQDAPNDGYTSEGELNTRALVVKQNKKKKSKSGGFQAMGISQPVLKGILKKGYKVPTPIQRKTIPLLLEGKDVVAMARTGSGKTAAFLVPLFERLKVHAATTGARALVLSPTRELALQTLKFTKELGRFTGLRAAVILGGDSIEGQFEVIHSNPDIIIATPGRFVHLCVEMELKMNHVEYVVFDEADRLFEMGFSEQLQDIISRIPEIRQTLLFSATLPKLLVDFARAGLTDPILIRLDVETKLSENLKMAFIKCNTEDKLAALLFILRNIVKEREQSVIFAATKHHVEYLHLFLDLVGIQNTYIYSSLDQTARKINVAKFQSKKIRCLIVTDVAARGIDIPLLDNVINFNFPAKSKLFVHRVGRVARAGRSGNAFTLVAPDEAAYLLDLHLFLSESIRFAPSKFTTEDTEWDRMYGVIPQTIIDNEADQIQSIHKSNHELIDMKRVSVNGYKKYVKSRPLPSSESIRRMKEESWDRYLGSHPIFSEYLVDNKSADTCKMEQQRQSLLSTLKTLRPRTTVFELNQSKKTRNTSNMHIKRIQDQSFINNFYTKMEDRKASKKDNDVEDVKNEEHVSVHLAMSTEKDIKNTFSTVDGKRKSEGVANQDILSKKQKHQKDWENNNIKNFGKKTKKLSQTASPKKDVDYKQDGYFIPYCSKDRYTDQGYSVATSFERDAAHAEMDIHYDTNNEKGNPKSSVKWNRELLRYVGDGGKPKRIKTESGVWIPSSYKTDRYKKWKERSKNRVDRDSDNEDDDAGAGKNSGRRHMKQVQPSYSKKHPLLKGKPASHGKKGPKRELKTKEEIQKARKTAFKRRQHVQRAHAKKGHRKNSK